MMSSNIDTMDETRAWSGDAHTAATKMFGRAADAANDLAAYTKDVGAAFRDGAGTIGEARTALLNKADEIDMTGQLHVSDQWVVMITGAAMTAEQAAALERRAQTEQITINKLLLAVGAADDDTATAVTQRRRKPRIPSAQPERTGQPASRNAKAQRRGAQPGRGDRTDAAGHAA